MIIERGAAAFVCRLRRAKGVRSEPPSSVDYGAPRE